MMRCHHLFTPTINFHWKSGSENFDRRIRERVILSLYIPTTILKVCKTRKEGETMASSVISSAAVTTVNRASPSQTSMVAPFNGLKSTSAFPVTRKTNNDITSISSNGGRVQCMQVWPTTGKKKFETFSYLPPLTDEQLLKEISYLLRSGWIPCLEFELENPYIHRKYHASPGYYDGRYWTMWKLPMYGCTDATQVLAEVGEAKKAYPNAFVRIIGFDNKRQVQCISFIAYTPPGAA